jgi:ABC-type multidrug transport system ATPase subunit
MSGHCAAPCASPSQASAAFSPFAATPPPLQRQHRHRRHRHDILSSTPDANGTYTTVANSATTPPSNRARNDSDGASPISPAPDSNPNPNSVASSRSRNHRSRRYNAMSRTGAAFDLLGDGVRSGLAICCDGVSVQRHHCDVIDDVSCLLRGGRVTAVVNCCGSHSALALLAALAGRVDCAAGSIVMNGVPVSASTYQAQMSFVEEKDSLTDDGGATSDLLAELTVRENLEYASKLRVANSAQAYSVDEVLQQLLLEPHEHVRIRDSSLYVRRRVALGKELLLNPSVLLLAEPMDGLATHEAQQLLTILSKLAAPSAADAEARHAMREAMAASAAASLSSGVVVAAAAALSSTPSAAAESPSSAPRVSLYTPRHSRMHPVGNQSSGSGLSPPPTRPPSTASAAASHAATSNNNNMDISNRDDNNARRGLPVPLGDETQRVVILSIVQPRWALLQYVHDVVLLERRRCVFAGSVQMMLSVKLPKTALRPGVADAVGASALAATGLREGEAEDGADPQMRSSTQVVTASLSPIDTPADSYDAVAASIHQTRLNEELVHGLYRLATTAAVAGGGVTATDFPEFGSFTDDLDVSEPRGDGSSNNNASNGGGAGQHSRSSSLVAVRADGNYTTPLSQLYTVQFGHTRAQVTAYMEVCAAGLLSLPEASHQPPSSFTQLLYLFRFGFVELRHSWISDVVALILMVAVAAALAAVYGVQVGQRGIQNCAGILFFLVCLVVLQAVLTLDLQRREYAAFSRYSRSGYYVAWTFLLYRAVTAALWRFGFTSFVALVVFVLSNFGEPWREYRGVFELGAIMAVLSYCCYFLIWFLCSWWPSDRVSRFVVFTFYTFNIVLAGLVLNLATLPAVLQGVSFLSVMRLAYESSILTHFVNKSFGCNESIVTTRAPGGDHHRDSAATPSLGSLLQRIATADAVTLSAKGQQLSAYSSSRHRSHSATMVGGTLRETMCYTGAEYTAYLDFDVSRRWSNVGILAGLSAVLLVGSWIMMVLYRPRRRLKVSVW